MNRARSSQVGLFAADDLGTSARRPNELTTTAGSYEQGLPSTGLTERSCSSVGPPFPASFESASAETMRPTASTRCPTRSFISNASAASGDMSTAKVSPENVAPLSLRLD